MFARLRADRVPKPFLNIVRMIDPCLHYPRLAAQFRTARTRRFVTRRALTEDLKRQIFG